MSERKVIINGRDVTKFLADNVKLGLKDLQTNSKRNGLGEMHFQLVAQKRTLSLDFPILSDDELKSILGLFEGIAFFNINYYEPLEGQQVTKVFYKGDRDVEIGSTFNKLKLEMIEK